MTTIDKRPSKRPIGSALLPEGSAGAVGRWFPTQWPRICGENLLPLQDDAFLTAPFRSRYQPGLRTPDLLTFIRSCDRDPLLIDFNAQAPAG